ncbi:hypothetical protein EV193_1011116 [Herbihabitans rhizosphaerae]|uniref:Major facilitator superfamily (MFS) profile domain-containing protein n=1 Tax=Herbihabitans rhizosphaerae TaxID=1872711 RepID=A0A4Q7L6B1_9PSEU|nr:hypothetical protein EV193_1011116 [Herbihabitans rhizosphaerae]
MPGGGLAGELGGAEHLASMVTAYMLAETVVTPLVGKFGDMFGRRVVFQVSVLVFGIGSPLCGFRRQPRRAGGRFAASRVSAPVA